MNTKLNKSDWIILAIIYCATIFFNAINYYREGNVLIEYLIDLPSSAILSLLVVLIFIKVLVPHYLVKKRNYVLFILFTVCILTFFGTLDNSIALFTGGKTFVNVKSTSVYILSGLFNGSDIVGLPLGILLIKKFYESQIQVSKIEQQQKDNELKLLRSQIDPHFLFNNLNTLDSLIDSNTDKAKEYINRLSLIYRYLITTKDAEVMELSKEINFAENYVFLIQTRFPDDYNFNFINHNSSQNKFIPTGALQTLLENVVKHNKAIKNNTIKTTITIEEDWITIVNSKSNLSINSESLGTGLQNLKSRYKLLIDKQINVLDTDVTYKISIPIIKLSNEN